MDWVEKAAARLSGQKSATGPEPAEQERVVPLSTAVHERSAREAEASTRTSRTRQRKSRDTSSARYLELNFAELEKEGILTPNTPRSPSAEQVRIIKRSLLFRALARRERENWNRHLIMMTSARPGEGKTFMSLNLAMSIALERDLTVLLIDADVPNPGLSAILGLRGRRGLVDLLEDQSLEVSDVMFRTNLENFRVIPVGKQHPMSSELLASDRMGRLVEEVAQRYQNRIIIFDTAPILATSEPSMLVSHAGQVLLVVEAERTQQSDIAACLDLIAAPERVSLVLNKAPRYGSGSYFGSYYGYSEGYGYSSKSNAAEDTQQGSENRADPAAESVQGG